MTSTFCPGELLMLFILLLDLLRDCTHIGNNALRGIPSRDIVVSHIGHHQKKAGQCQIPHPEKIVLL